MTEQHERFLAYMPLDDIPSALINPKLHDPDLIESSINRFGFLEVPVIDERTGRLIAGHGRRDQLLAMREEGQPPPEGVSVTEDGTWLVPTVRGWSSKDDDEAHAAGVALNRGAEAGGWDDRGLTDLLRDLHDNDPDLGLIGTGYDPMVLANLAMVTRTAQEILDFNAAAEWVGLPDYEPEERPWKLVISCATNAERERFLDELGVREHITFTHGDGRTISAWFPKRDAPVHDTGLRWEDHDPLAGYADLPDPLDLPGVGLEGTRPEGSLDGPLSGSGGEAEESPGGEPPTALDPAQRAEEAGGPAAAVGEGEGDPPGETGAERPQEPASVEV